MKFEIRKKTKLNFGFKILDLILKQVQNRFWILYGKAINDNGNNVETVIT